MSANQSRRSLRIDIFDQHQQRALVLPTLTPPALVTAILQEFRALEYLSTDPAHYYLCKVGTQTPLPEQTFLGQLAQDEQLILTETELPLPPGTQRPTKALYLREGQQGAVYKLHWWPAILGRPDATQPHQAWVAVNLEKYPGGLRVSRRHLQIEEAQGGGYTVHSLSPRNPAYRCTAAGQQELITTQKLPLHHGDSLLLEGSELTLKFLIREG
ncbi:MAG: FHA domain-containing protein [Caldilineaceae bacterium]|nr:FHA domain-containing protein [Caldilineaceae bacterium]